MRSALRSAAETNSPGPLTETCNCSTSPKSRSSARAALSAAFPMTFKVGDRVAMAKSPRVSRPCPSVLGSLDVASVGSADDDACARADMRRDHHPAPVLELARLVGGRRGLPSHHRIAFDDKPTRGEEAAHR